MALFDFVSGENFRLSLEADYRELDLTMKAGAWKAVHVLAGSIIETLLVDHLVASGYQKRTSKDPLKMRLEDIIAACKTEKALSEKTEQFSHVIRSYRNLIHPGRVVRLSETVDENGATIAHALVNIVIKELSMQRKDVIRYTAEKITQKLVLDTSKSSRAILSDLLQNTTEFELERLVLEVIPNKYFELQEEAVHLSDDEYIDPGIYRSLATCFRLAFDAVEEEIKKKVAKNFIRILKEESASTVYTYETVFFRGRDLHFFSKEDAQLVKHHFLITLDDRLGIPILNSMEGIGKFITSNEVLLFIDPLVAAVTTRHLQVIGKSTDKIKEMIVSECQNTEADVKNEILSRLDEWIGHFTEQGSDEYFTIIQDLKESIET